MASANKKVVYEISINKAVSKVTCCLSCVSFVNKAFRHPISAPMRNEIENVKKKFPIAFNAFSKSKYSLEALPYFSICLKLFYFLNVKSRFKPFSFYSYIYIITNCAKIIEITSLKTLSPNTIEYKSRSTLWSLNMAKVETI